MMRFLLETASEGRSIEDWIGTLVVFLIYGLVSFFSRDKKEKKPTKSHSDDGEEEKAGEYRLQKREEKHQKKKLSDEKRDKRSQPSLPELFVESERHDREGELPQPSRGRVLVQGVENKKRLLIYKEIFDLPLSLRPYDKL